MSYNVPSQNNVKTRRDKITIILSNAFIGELCKKIPISKKPVYNKCPTEYHLKTMSKLAPIKLHLTLITNPYLTYYLLLEIVIGRLTQPSGFLVFRYLIGACDSHVCHNLDFDRFFYSDSYLHKENMLKFNSNVKIIIYFIGFST